MANTPLDINTEYNIRPLIHGNGLLDPDTTYEFVDALPTENIRQDTFYKVNGSDSLYWYNGAMWVDLTQTIVKSGIVYVGSLPTTNIDNELIYSITGSGVLHYYSGNTGDPYDPSKWIDISTNHVVEVSTLPASGPQNILYSKDDILWWWNGSKWMDLVTDYGIITVQYRSDITNLTSKNLYWETDSSILWWHDGTNWHDCSTNFGIVEVTTRPTTNIRQNCFYKETTGTDTNYIFWWNGTEWINVTKHPGIVITNSDHTTITNPEPDILYNYTGDGSLWWYNTYDAAPAWVDLAADTNVTIVNGLPTTGIRQTKLYYDISHNPPTVYWWSGSKWIEVTTTYGIVEVNSISDLTTIRRDCFYVEPDSEADSLYWYDGGKWHKIARHTGIEIVNALPSATNANDDNLYFVNPTSLNYDGKLWWHDSQANVWHDLTMNNGIVEVTALPVVNIRTDCIYKNLGDNHIYYYWNGAWACLDYNYGVNIVDALPTTNIPMDKIYKIRTTNKLYWYNGNRWIDISANGGMTSVTALPAVPPDYEVLYRLTQDQPDPADPTVIQYYAGVYAWWNGEWNELRMRDAVDRGLDDDSGRIGHTNSVTAVATEQLSSITYDEYGHVTSSTKKTLGRDINDQNGVIGHANDEVTPSAESLKSVAYDNYGHITASTEKTLGRDINEQNNVIGHANAEITANSNSRLKYFTHDNYGHVTGSVDKTLGRGLSDVNNVIGHSNNQITPDTTPGLKAITYDQYGHITTGAAKDVGRGLSDENDTVGHSNPQITPVTEVDELHYNYTYDQYGHITSRHVVPSVAVQVNRGLNIDSNTAIGHINSVTADNTVDNRNKVIKYDEYGHVTGHEFKPNVYGMILGDKYYKDSYVNAANTEYTRLIQGDKGIKLTKTNTGNSYTYNIDHTNSITKKDSYDYTPVKITYDDYGHITGSSAVNYLYDLNYPDSYGAAYLSSSGTYKRNKIVKGAGITFTDSSSGDGTSSSPTIYSTKIGLDITVTYKTVSTDKVSIGKYRTSDQSVTLDSIPSNKKGFNIVTGSYLSYRGDKDSACEAYQTGATSAVCTIHNGNDSSHSFTGVVTYIQVTWPENA